MKKLLPFILPLILLLGLGWMFLQSKNKNGVYKQLPILGNHQLDTLKNQDGSVKIDTLFHTIPQFNLMNQYGKLVSNEAVKGRVYVADYFFTTCQSICPIMSKQLDRVYKARPEVMILSHTVDPETDSSAQLLRYSEKFKTDGRRWIFLTGNKPALYELARKGYLLDAREGDGGAEDFIHTQNFALIDKKGRIRGYYDGTDSTAVNELITDIGFLLQE